MGTNSVWMDRMRRDVVSNHPLTGFAKLKQFQKRDNYGSGWVGPGLTRNLFIICFGKSSQNSPIPVLVFLDSICHVHFVFKYVIKSCWLLSFECSVHIGVNISERKSGTERTKKRKKGELVRKIVPQL